MARRIVPDLVVSTDIIVGFPGETDRDFQATLDVVAEAQFDSAYTFKFSPRPGTPAAEYDDQVPEQIVRERFDRLLDLQNATTYAKNQARVGRRLEILVEGASKRDETMSTGRTRGNRLVHLPGAYESGVFLDVEVTAAGKHHLIGRAI
jgi:tRNA-2-methylthio-N6-dimethylallyladenosine synthase